MPQLILAEKPSVAKSISAVLGATIREDGYYSGNGYCVSWCVGHLVELAPADAYDARYAQWRREDLPIIPDKFRLVVPKGKMKQVKIIMGLMARPDVETIVNACDAGREGELIFRLVCKHCHCTKPVQRLWISSMEEQAIADGFAKLRPGAEYTDMYYAAQCRAQADWIVGINGTRLFSVLYGGTLNVGRVMTPTLALLVQRDAEISAFQKESWFMVELACGENSGAGFTANGEKHRDKRAAEDIRDACNGQPVFVKSVETQQKTTNPPKLHDLTTLQREANRLFGFTAQQTLDYLQSLYEKKLATYPRTDSRYLTEDMAATAEAIVEHLQKHAPFAQGVGFTPCLAQVIDNTKVSDHHAVIPTMQITTAKLDGLLTGERNILELLCARLLCATAEPHVYEERTVTLDCGGHSFTAKGKTTRQDGWKAIERRFLATLKDKPKEDTAAVLPKLEEGQSVPCAAPAVKEGFTSPPRPYSEDTLLSAMEHAGAADMPEDAEHKGLGTPATRAATIEKLVTGGFVQRAKRQLLPTDKGKNLITVLPDTLKSPALTAEWEGSLKQVERGTLAPESFMRGIAAMTRELVQNHTAPVPEYVRLFAKPQAAPVGVCPRCGGAVVEGAKGFSCENRACGFALWKNDRFFTGKGVALDKKIAAALLKGGRALVSGLVSKKTGRKYSAAVVLADTGKYVNFKMEFPMK